jgi:tetratricopeptide (TPR) repeat protein
MRGSPKSTSRTVSRLARARLQPFGVAGMIALLSPLSPAGIGVAFAQNPPAASANVSNEQLAAEKFSEGRKLLDEGRFREACQMFEQSLALDSSPGTLLNLGNCYEQLGGLLKALATFERAFGEARQEADPTKRQGWISAAQQRIDALSTRVPELLVHPSPTPGATIQLNGQALTSLGAPMRLDPGRYRLEANAVGKLPFVKTFDLGTGQKLEVAIPVLEDAPVAAPEVAAVAPPPQRYEEPPAASGSRYGIAPWILIGGGAALIGGGIITGLSAKAKADELEENCPNSVCNDPSLEDTRDSGKTLALVTDVLFVAGLVSAGVGVTLLVLDSSSTQAGAAPSSTLRAGCFGAACGVSAQGSF